MPPITVTLTETEAGHIRELCEEDHKTCEFGLKFNTNPDIRGFYEAIDTVNQSIIEKVKDA